MSKTAPHHPTGVGPLLKDFRFTLRSLCRAWGYTATILFTLVLGVTVTTLVYDIAGWMIFHRSPYPHSEQLFFVGYRDKLNEQNFYRPGLFLRAYQEQAGDVMQFVGMGSAEGNVVMNGEPIPAYTALVSIGMFDMLGIKPAMGRAFLPGEDKEGSDGVLVITNKFWKEHFAGSPDALGRTILIDQKVCTVVGVLPNDAPLPYYGGGEIFKPLVPPKLNPHNIWSPGVFILGRLKPGVTTEQALGVLAKVQVKDLPAWAVKVFADQTPLLSGVSKVGQRDAWWVMLAAGAFLYAIACLNAMNLMLIRLIGRRRELSIRFAVGGSRWQVLRILLVECAVLSSAAYAMATVAAFWGLPFLMHALYGDNYSMDGGFWDFRTLSFIAELSAATCALTAIAPVVRLLRMDVGAGLKDGGAATGESRPAARFRTLLVALQAAFAVVLLVGTGLMLRSFDRLGHMDYGFDPTGKVKVRVQFPSGYDIKPEAKLQLYDRLQASLSRLPGVRDAAYAEDALLNEWASISVNMQMADGTFKERSGSVVAANYLQAGGLVLKRGRWLSGKSGIHEVVLNEKLARTQFGDKDPIGRFVTMDLTKKGPYEVVGVVGNVRSTERSEPGGWFYAPAWERPAMLDTFILRLDSDPGPEFAGLVRRAIYATDPRLYTYSIQSIRMQVSDSMWAERNVFTMLKGLGVVALVLTVVGIFSVISFTVDSRMMEFGVRVAVGATSGDLVRIVMRRGLASVTAGLAMGVAGALALTRFMQSLLFETAPFDPLVYTAVTVLLLAAAAAACLLPARRAAKVDVIKLLKSD